MFIKYNANGEPISYTSADIRPDDLSTNAFGAGAYAKTGAKNYAIRQVAGYRVGLFALEGEESYGYCKNSDLTRMDCAEVARVYARFLKEEKAAILSSPSATAAWKRTGHRAAQEGFLDVIQNAHDHLAYDQPIVENGVIMTSTGCYAQNMGVLSLQKTSVGWTWVPEETCCYELTKAYDYEDPRDLSPEALAYRSMQDLLARYDADLTAPDGYFSKLGLDDVTPDSVVMTIPTGYDYIQYEDGKAIGYTYIQSPVTAFICDSFNYASGSQVSFVFGGYVRTALYQGDFTVADAFNEQSTGESAIDHSAGSSLVSATCPVHSWHPSVSLMLRAPVSPLRAGPTAVPAPSTPEICATAITFLTGRSPVMFPASKSISRRATAGSLWTSTKPTPPLSPLNPPRTW